MRKIFECNVENRIYFKYREHRTSYRLYAMANEIVSRLETLPKTDLVDNARLSNLGEAMSGFSGEIQIRNEFFIFVCKNYELETVDFISTFAGPMDRSVWGWEVVSRGVWRAFYIE